MLDLLDTLDTQGWTRRRVIVSIVLVFSAVFCIHAEYWFRLARWPLPEFWKIILIAVGVALLALLGVVLGEGLFWISIVAVFFDFLPSFIIDEIDDSIEVVIFFYGILGVFYYLVLLFTGMSEVPFSFVWNRKKIARSRNLKRPEYKDTYEKTLKRLSKKSFEYQRLRKRRDHLEKRMNSIASAMNTRGDSNEALSVRYVSARSDFQEAERDLETCQRERDDLYQKANKIGSE